MFCSQWTNEKLQNLLNSEFWNCDYFPKLVPFDILGYPYFCQTLGLVLRLRVDFVLPLSQEQEEQEEQEQEQEEQPLTKIYQKGVY